MSQRNLSWERLHRTERLRFRDAHGKRWLLQVYAHHSERAHWLVKMPPHPTRADHLMEGTRPTLTDAKVHAMGRVLAEVERGGCPVGRRLRLRLEHLMAMLALGGGE
jgi:hypothetical protein